MTNETPQSQRGPHVPVDGTTLATNSPDATESPIFSQLVIFTAAAIGLLAAIWSWRALHNDFQRTLVVVGVMCLMGVLSSIYRSRSFYTWRRLADLGGVVAICGCGAMLAISLIVSSRPVQVVRQVIRSPSAVLSSPVNRAPVSQAQGFTASGTVIALGADTIWILDYDGGYTADQQATVTAGHWTAKDYPLGERSQALPFKVIMIAALASPKCSAQLSKYVSSSNDYFYNLPSGCKLFGAVSVIVVRR